MNIFNKCEDFLSFYLNLYNNMCLQFQLTFLQCAIIKIGEAIIELGWFLYELGRLLYKLGGLSPPGLVSL